MVVRLTMISREAFQSTTLCWLNFELLFRAYFVFPFYMGEKYDIETQYHAIPNTRRKILFATANC